MKPKTKTTGVDWDAVAKLVGEEDSLMEPPPGAFTVEDYCGVRNISESRASKLLRQAHTEGKIKRVAVRTKGQFKSKFYYFQ